MKPAAQDLADALRTRSWLGQYPRYEKARFTLGNTFVQGAENGLPVVRVLGYEDARRVFSTPEVFSADVLRFPAALARRAPLRSIVGGMIFDDGSYHLRTKGDVGRALSRQARNLSPFLDTFATELLDRCQAGGSIDFIDSVAAPFTSGVMAKLLAIPDGQRRAFHAQVQQFEPIIIEGITNVSVARLAKATAAVIRLTHESRGFMAADSIGDEPAAVVSALRDVDVHTATGNFFMLYVAGYETTRSGAASALAALYTNPQTLEEFKDLARAAGKISDLFPAVEELLRFDAPGQVKARIVTQPYDLGRLRLQPGQVVYVHIGAANHDPDIYDRPSEVRLDRLGRGAPAPMTFGHDLHNCIGRNLAVLEIATLLRLAVERVEIRPGQVHSLSTTPSKTFSRLDRLPVTLEVPGRPPVGFGPGAASPIGLY